MTKFNLIFIHPFFFGFFPIVSLYSYNLGIIPIQDFFYSIGISILAISVSHLILFFIFKKPYKTSLVLSLGIILFFFYGHFYNLLSGFYSDTYLNHRFVLIPFIIFFIIPIIFIFKTNNKLDNINKIVTSISVILLIISSSNILVNTTFSEDVEINSIINENTLIKQNPDIYYLILDAYGDAYTLDRHFNYDNSNFVDFLKAKGFQNSDPSFSNYHTTYLSLSSSLNFDYVNNLLDEKNSSFDVISAHKMIDKNRVMKTLNEFGYVTINFDSGWGPTRQISEADFNFCNQNYFTSSEFLISIAETSIMKLFYAKFFDSDHRERILCALKQIPIIGTDIEKPIFVFAHLLLPHPPYIFDHLGNPTMVESLQFSSNDIINEKELYLDQLQFTNLMIKEIVEILSSENAIIIIQSDHGPPDSIFALKNNDSTDKDKLRNINYYYFPDDKKIIYDGITPVNSFRIIFKNYLSNDLEILPDRNFYIDEKENQYKLIEITNELSN